MMPLVSPPRTASAPSYRATDTFPSSRNLYQAIPDLTALHPDSQHRQHFEEELAPLPPYRPRRRVTVLRQPRGCNLVRPCTLASQITRMVLFNGCSAVLSVIAALIVWTMAALAIVTMPLCGCGVSVFNGLLHTVFYLCCTDAFIYNALAASAADCIDMDLAEEERTQVLGGLSNAIGGQTTTGTRSKENGCVLQQHVSANSPRVRAILLQAVKNSNLATCWKCNKEIALNQVELVLSRSEFALYMAWHHKKMSPRANCVSCAVKKDKDELRVAPCGHDYCQPCLLRMCRLALGNRALVPLRCCKKELPDDYVREALREPRDYAKYQQLVREKDWKVSDLQSDAEYSATVRAMGAKQCPGCGIGVQRDFGCVHMACPNGHQFCYTCLRLWGSCNCPLIPEAELRVILGEIVPLRCCEKVVPHDFIREVLDHEEDIYYSFLLKLPPSDENVKKADAKPSAVPQLPLSARADATILPLRLVIAGNSVPGQVNSTPVVAPAQPLRRRYLTRSSKIGSGTEHGVNGSLFKAPCGDQLCLKCVETDVRRYLNTDPKDNGVPASCCGKVLPMDLVRRVVSGKELMMYAKRKVKYVNATTGPTAPTTRGTKRKAAPEKKTTQPAKGSKGKAPAKRAKKAVNQENERVCIACYSAVRSPGKWQVVPCGHGYCLPCLANMAKTSLTDRKQVPISCCSKEFPMDYVEKALTNTQFLQYKRYLAERDPKTSTLQSDRDYATLVQKNRGKQSMEVLPELDELKELASADQFEHVVYLNSDTIDFVDEVDGEAAEAQLAEVYALEVYREEICRAEQVILDEAVALSFYAKEENKLLHPADADLETYSDEDSALGLVEIESKPPPNCTSCLTPLDDKAARRILTCGHLYCMNCIATRCRMGVRDRSMVPAHCCKREFPSDYVKEALDKVEFATYERFLKDKDWRSLDLQSDRDYAKVVRQNHAVQCPGCGVGQVENLCLLRLT
ncbi:hypothetical protein JG688_00000156 [Phytophthora aleatoria]|uniref:RING-type domain-containing protein n=1 Tax=Phytophthora aleatoria TaxID=2496075 RepID=A0A8J5J6S6_9STRA|nr:hypothetical protein JG688_00000156 [Phytophthora aleatoria]